VNNSAAFRDMTSQQQVESLNACVAEIVAQYNLDVTATESINHEFNSTYKVTTADGERFALRINVNSTRTLENLKAEIFWVKTISTVKVPKPVSNATGEYITFGYHDATGRRLASVLYTWLEGEELGDEPTIPQLRATGEAMARLHLQSAGLQLPSGASLPDLSDYLWGSQDLLTGPETLLSPEELELIKRAKAAIEQTVIELRMLEPVQPIHADIHPWNVMWHNEEVAVFDFDDSGIGLRAQDIATSLFYLDTPEQETALLDGYRSVAPLPKYTEAQMKLLLLQRRIFLLNYLNETSYPEHREMLPKYQVGTISRVSDLLQ
jgi:Ser/Thr protein kinase RdoA (MazF antagonist)